jgi:putative addiction module killer protein
MGWRCLNTCSRYATFSIRGLLLVKVYESEDGKRPFDEWLRSLKDPIARATVRARVDRVAEGNPGDAKPVGSGVSELRIHYGPGYRIYLAQRNRLVLLLCGGSKKTQTSDIVRAVRYWKDYLKRNASEC